MSAASQKQPSHTQVTQIELTPDELASRKVGSHHLQAAVEALHRDGMVVLSNAVDPAHLDKLNERMVPEAKELYSRATTHRNFGNETGNIQQEPVLEDGYIFDDVLANPWATDITQCMFGPKPSLRFYSANTAFRATGRQPPHLDIDFAFPAVPFGYCVNINLVATSAENGATEVWLGSHLNDTTTGVLLETDPETGHRQIRADLQDRRRNELGCPPVQPSLPKGVLVIRDFRLWHAGMPNRTDEPRVMLVSVQFPSWYRSDLKMKLPASIKDKMRWGDLIPCAEWMPEGYDYLKGAHDHDFTLLP
ncbi:phytanoyl-CoA dioxygenase family protein [Apiospora arundinis]